MSVMFFMKFVDMTLRVYNMWRYERMVKYMKNQLLKRFFLNVL
jgi:hypothetical protein